MFYNKLTILLLAGCTLICASQLDVQLKDAQTAVLKDTTLKPTPSTTSTVPPTTTAAPSTTPAPAPYPDPSIGTWNSSCILVKMAVQLNFTYETKDKGTATKLYNLPADAKFEDSDCSNNNTQSIQINWGPADAKGALVMRFDNIQNTTKLTMMYFTFPLTSDSFPNAKSNQSIQLLHRGWDFISPVKMSYHCTRAQRLNLTETADNKTVIGYAMIHDVQTQAFRGVNAKGFAEAHDCDSSETSDIVPIAVGIALAVLILIVLVSYLCARRRSTSRGYMSF